jgi:heptosyltransferase-2
MTLPANVHRVVVRPPNWLGDAVLALPALAAVRRAFPDAHLTVAGAPAVAALFREGTDVDPDAVLDLSGSPREMVQRLASPAFDLGVLFPNSFRSAWIFRQAGIRERWGYATPARGWLLTRRARRVRGAGSRHMVDYYRRLVRGLGVAAAEDPPRLRASPASDAAAAAVLARAGLEPASGFVAFAPGAAYGQAKQWPPARVAEVIAGVVRARGVSCVLVGAGHDRPAARAIESWLRAHAPETRARVVDLVGRTSLGVLVGVTARAAAFVSNDSGAMHLAAALGRPVVAVFGPTDERATGPIGDHDVLVASAFCRPCLLRDCPIDHRCMKRVPADRVAAALLGRLPPELA